MTDRTYFESFDAQQLLRQFPMDQAFTDKFTRISRDELHALARRWNIRIERDDGARHRCGNVHRRKRGRPACSGCGLPPVF